MIKLYERDTKSETEMLKIICTLSDASDVKISSEINGEYSLTFNYPVNGRYMKKLALNLIAFCEGQPYRIMRITSSTDDDMFEVFCLHVYDADAPAKHIASVNEVYGVSPRSIIVTAFADTDFSVMNYDEITALGLRWVGGEGEDDFKIDFETTDKTSPYSVMKQVIENCGYGEIYRDGYKVALVKSVGGYERMLGAAGTLKLSAIKNMASISIERDMSSIVNRLYPYGADDAGIAGIASNGNKAYIDSENSQALYGIKEGYRDYSDYKQPAKVLQLAQWEFNAENPDRIDMPAISISGNIIDLSVLDGYGNSSGSEIPALGKGIRITDIDGTEYTDRVTKLVYYPYEPEKTSITIGHIQRDESFYIEQMGKTVGLNIRTFGQ